MRPELAVRCQETVKKADIRLETSVTSNMLKSLRLELSQSLSEFGLTLKREIEPRAERGFSRQYISRLEHGQDMVTPEIAGAFWSLAGMLDDVPAGIGGAVSVTVLAQPGQIVEGAFLKRSLSSRRCQGCNVVFIGPGKFHDAECRRAFWKRTRRGKTADGR